MRSKKFHGIGSAAISAPSRHEGLERGRPECSLASNRHPIGGAHRPSSRACASKLRPRPRPSAFLRHRSRQNRRLARNAHHQASGLAAKHNFRGPMRRPAQRACNDYTRIVNKGARQTLSARGRQAYSVDPHNSGMFARGGRWHGLRSTTGERRRRGQAYKGRYPLTESCPRRSKPNDAVRPAGFRRPSGEPSRGHTKGRPQCTHDPDLASQSFR